MKLTRRFLLISFCLIAVGTGAVAQQQPSRLLVTNNTGTTVDLFSMVNGKWQSRGRVSPGSSTSIYNVANGQRFRAVWASKPREHTVKLTYDRSYGGWQDVLTLR